MADNNPYQTLEDFGQSTGAKKKKQQPSGFGSTPAQQVEQAQFDYSPDEEEATSINYGEVFGKIPEDWAYNAPNFVQWITYPKSTMHRLAAQQAYTYWTSIFGAELAPTLQASLMTDPQQREQQFRIIGEIAKMDLAPIMPVARGPGATRVNTTVDPDMLSRVLSDPTILDNMQPAERNAYIEQAKLADSNLKLQTSPDLARQLWAISGQTLTRNYDVFMNDEEKQALQTVLDYGKTGDGDTSLAPARETLGISSIENAGHANPTVTLDEEWARTHPVRAAAVMDFLRVNLPQVQYRVGEKGMVGDFLDKWGKAVDFVSAPIGAAYGYAGERIGELDEAIHRQYTDEDRARFATEAESLRKSVTDGRVEPEDVQYVLNTAAHLEDASENNVNYDWGEAIDNGLHPKQAGMGFAENYTSALDLLPGDPGYDQAYAISGLVANIVLDPANYIFPAISGIRQGVKTVSGMAELPGKIDVGINAFKAMGKAPKTRTILGGLRGEATKTVTQAATTLEDVVGKGRYAILPTGDDAVLKIIKNEPGLGAAAKITYNGQDAILVPKMTPEKAIQFGNELGLDEVLSTEGLITVSTREIRPVEKVMREVDNADVAVQFGDQAWGYRLATKKIKARPPRASTNFTKNWFFQHTVKTPDQWAGTLPAKRAISHLWNRRAAVGRERFLALVQRLGNMDEHTARLLADARSEEDMMQGFLAGMTGNARAPFNAARSEFRRTELKSLLDEYDGLDAKIAELEQTNFVEQLTIDDLDEVFRDITRGNGRTGMFAQEITDRAEHAELLRRLQDTEPGAAIDDVIGGLDETEQAFFRNAVMKRRAAASNILNQPEKLVRGRAFASGGQFYTEVPTSMLRDPNIVVDTGFVGIRRRINTPRDDEYLAGLKADIEKNGIKDPLMLEVTPEGKLIVVDGTHRAMLAEEMGMENVPAVFSTNGLEAADRTYVWLDQHLPNALLETKKLPDDLTELIEENAEIRKLTDRKKELGAIRDDTIMELSYLRSMASGREFNLAIRELPSRQAWRTFMGRENAHPMFKLLDLTRDQIMKSVDFVSMARQKTWARFVGTKEFFESEKSATQLSRAYGSFLRTHGAGGIIHLAPLNVAGDVADVGNEAIDQLRNLAKTFGMKDERIEELLGQLIDSKGYNDRYNWYVNYWETIADESPLLGAVQRKQLRDIWPETLGDRSPGKITTSKPGEILNTMDTHWGMKRDKRGNPYPSGRPAFSADMLHSVRLPNIETVLDMVSFNRRLLANMKQAGGARKLTAEAVSVMQGGWEFTNRLWKSAILMARMPLGLPLRIIGEEHLRMAAFDNASLVNHPLEWMRMFKSREEFAQFADFDLANLGLLHEQFLTDYKLARYGRRSVHVEDGDDFWRAYGVILAKRAKSPEVKRWYIDNEPEQILEIMQGEEGLRRGSADLLKLWDEAIDPSDPMAMRDRLTAVRQVKQEVTQLIGTGPGAEKIEAAMRTGRMSTAGGETVEAGTIQFKNELQRMYDAEEWTPGAKEIPSTELEYVWEDSRMLLRKFRDWSFTKFYTNPDAKWARAPLFRGIARREYDRLISIGWNPRKAEESARAHAYRRTADMLYHIGETSAGHHFLRNISPFFPAWQELSTTWLYRIPKQLGGGFLLPGYARLARKADVWMDFFKNAGIVQRRPITDKDGNVKNQYYVNIPFVGDALGALIGTAVPLIAPASLESFTGVLPTPTSVQDMLPSLGAPPAFVLGEIANKFEGTVDDLADALLPFGREVNLGPTAVDRLFMAAGIVPFWNSGTYDYQRTLKAFSVDDGIRIAMVKHGKEMPKREDFEEGQKGEDQYVAAHRKWAEMIVQNAENWASVTYGIRGVMSATMPFSFTFDSKYDAEMTRYWAMLSTLPGNGDQLVSPIIESFKATYPEAVWWSQGKTINLRPDREFSERDELMEEISNEMVLTMTPEEYLRWTVGMNSFSVYMNKRERAMQELGSTARDVLLNGFEKNDTLLPLQRDWEDYLDLTDAEAAPGQRSFHELFNIWQKARNEALSDSEKVSLSYDQDLALEVKRGLGYLASYFTQAGIRDVNLKKVMGKLGEIGSGGDFPEPSSEVGKALVWWYDNVASPYYDQTGKLYDKLRDLEAGSRGPIYDQLRNLANQQQPQIYKGIKMPTPEQVSFENLSPEEKEVRKLEWGTLPIEWLTSFQRKTVGATGPTKKMETLVSYIAQQEEKFDVVTSELSSGSNDYEAWREAFDNQYAQKAKELGVGKQYELMTRPVWQRVDVLFNKEFHNNSWDQTIQDITQLNQRFSANDVSLRGETESARFYQEWFMDKVDERRNRDPQFREILENFERAMAPTGKELLPGRDLYWKLFFEGFLNAPGYLLD